MSRLDDIIRMPAEKRRRLNLGSKKKRNYKRYPRRKRSREELIQYLKDNDVQSSRQLHKVRQDGDPIIYDYRKEFGKWSQALLAAHGPPLPSVGKFDAKYLASAVIEFGLWSKEKYQAKRMLRPDILPSMHFVRKEWGTFGNLKAYAKEVSMKQVLNRYLAFWRRLKRPPTLKECDSEGINLETPVKYFGSKREMDKLLAEMEI
jgi:hypothetical protein